MKAVKADATAPEELASALHGHDVVISAFNPGKDEGGTGSQSIIDGVKRSHVPRFLVVGGAGTLDVAPGKRLLDQPEFPAAWKEGAVRTAAFLDQLHNETQLDWVFLSPAAVITPGERTGKYRVGADQLITDAAGQSRISIENYEVAMVDEAESPGIRARVSQSLLENHPGLAQHVLLV